MDHPSLECKVGAMELIISLEMHQAWIYSVLRGWVYRSSLIIPSMCSKHRVIPRNYSKDKAKIIISKHLNSKKSMYLSK